MRPEAQLFLHVLGAVSLFGAVAAAAVLGLAGYRLARLEHGQLEHGQLEHGQLGNGRALAHGSLVATLAVAVPAWALTAIFGSWTKSREGLPGSAEWLRIGDAIATAGMLALLASTALAYAWTRRPAERRLPAALALVSIGYLLALGAAWWVMTTKVPS